MKVLSLKIIRGFTYKCHDLSKEHLTFWKKKTSAIYLISPYLVKNKKVYNHEIITNVYIALIVLFEVNILFQIITKYPIITTDKY